MYELISEMIRDRFEGLPWEAPYPDEAACHRDWLAFLSVCLVAAGLFKMLSDDADGDTPYTDLPGTAIHPERCMDYLGDYPYSIPQPDERVGQLMVGLHRSILSRCATTTAAGTPLRILRLKDRLGLSEYSFFALLCAFACATDRGFEQYFASLHGEKDLRCSTVGVVQSVYALFFPLPPEQAAALLDEGSRADRLLYTRHDRRWPPMLRPLALRLEAVAYLLGRPCLSRELSDCSVILDGAHTGEALFLEEQANAVSAAVRRHTQAPEASVVILCGAEGSGRKLTLELTARDSGTRFLLVELNAASQARSAALTESLAAAILYGGYLPCFTLEEEALPHLTHILDGLRDLSPLVFVLIRELRASLATAGYLVRRVSYPLPDMTRSVQLWRHFAAAMPEKPVYDWERLAATYTLSPGRIKSALRMAADGPSRGHQALADAVLLSNTGRLGAIADRIEVFYSWDDLVLGDAPKQLLRDAVGRIRHRHKVEEQWGFSGKSSYGKGISILLYGPPGTGKTMSAQVIAGELHLPLYRINLAQIISKYIGETAKNLDAVFTEARSSNVILFFDEADALFAKRTDVKNSNDRHANSESSYLLQKIEEYSGISILATNLAHNFDDAFRRRIGYMINIHMPGPEQRLAIWKQCFPAAAPLADDADFTLLAEELELSGSVIKSAAVQAAYYAAEEDAAIGMAHIARAVRLELVKLGKSEPHFLEIY